MKHTYFTLQSVSRYITEETHVDERYVFVPPKKKRFSKTLTESYFIDPIDRRIDELPKSHYLKNGEVWEHSCITLVFQDNTVAHYYFLSKESFALCKEFLKSHFRDFEDSFVDFVKASNPNLKLEEIIRSFVR